jgi:arsenical pump membrane protein
MTTTPRMLATLVVFGLMLLLVLLRPRAWHEAWWTTLGALAMLALRLVAPRDALATVRDAQAPLLFLLALLLLSLLIGKSGFFEWAAIRCANLARADGVALYRNTFVLGALITATLSLDTTAVILTPIVLALVKRLRTAALPYIALCAFVANVGSLGLPISNLTNILFAQTFHVSFAAFAARMLLPQLVALVVTYALLRWYFRESLGARFDPTSLPLAASVVPSHGYFVTSVVVLVAVLAGYFIAPRFGAPAYVVAFAGVIVLALVGLVSRQVQPRALREVSWGVFPFVIGLFIAVRALENLGFSALAVSALARLHDHALCHMFASAALTALASNIVNNLPAALLARDILGAAHAHAPLIFSALLGANAGSIVTPFGSLATMLVISLARDAGTEVSIGRMVRFGALLAPVVVLLTTLALAATFALAP